MKLDPDNASVDINLKLKERDGNKIGFNGGVSGAAGGFVGIIYSSNNFLGLGETMSVNLERGTKYSQYQLCLHGALYVRQAFNDRPFVVLDRLPIRSVRLVSQSETQRF